MNRHMTAKRRSPGKMTNLKQRIVEMTAQALMAEREFRSTSDKTYPLFQWAMERAQTLQQPDATVQETAQMAADFYVRIDEAFPEPYRPVPPTSKPLDQDMVSQNIGSFGRTAQQIQNRLQGRPAAPRTPTVRPRGGKRRGKRDDAYGKPPDWRPRRRTATPGGAGPAKLPGHRGERKAGIGIRGSLAGRDRRGDLHEFRLPGKD